MSYYDAPQPQKGRRPQNPQQQQQRRYGNNRNDDDDDDDDVNYGYDVPIEGKRLEPVEQPPRREFKYSTANMPKNSGRCKYCWICLMFILFIAFMVAFSMIMDHFFFNGVSDNTAPQPLERDENSTFNEDKLYIDQVCSTGTMRVDDGQRCEQTCEPQYFECCDPFNEFNLYNITNGLMGINPVDNITAPGYNETIKKMDLEGCSLDDDLMGCMSYAKCQALSGEVEPAPANLPVLCSSHGLERDRTSCEELCKRAKCCFAENEPNCLADNFAICSDYSPCQNLRERREYDNEFVETAPHDLDTACAWQLSECFDTCKKAECCGDPDSMCFKNNFMACLTYAPCQGVTSITIPLTEQFSKVTKPPNDIAKACDVDNKGRPMNPEQCMSLCQGGSCCWSTTNNCFRDDPLGCLAYEQQCQVLFDYGDTTTTSEP